MSNQPREKRKADDLTTPSSDRTPEPLDKKRKGKSETESETPRTPTAVLNEAEELKKQKAAQSLKLGHKYSLAMPHSSVFIITDLLKKDPSGAASLGRAALASYKNAAESGNAEAQLEVGHCYAFGIGTDPDPKAAYEWYMKAQKNGNSQAEYEIDALLEDFPGLQTAEQKSEASSSSTTSSNSGLGWTYGNHNQQSQSPTPTTVTTQIPKQEEEETPAHTYFS